VRGEPRARRTSETCDVRRSLFIPPNKHAPVTSQKTHVGTEPSRYRESSLMFPHRRLSLAARLRAQVRGRTNTARMADREENERLRAELEATRQQLAQSQAANAARPGEVAVSIAEGVPAPGEATPLNGQPLPRAHSVVAMGKAVQDNKLAAGSSSQTCMGILFAIACLAIYYLNGGDHANCSTKLPFFLKVNGFASIAYILTTAVLVYLSTRGKMSSDSVSFKSLACVTSVVGCFLFAWFICGLVRPRHFEQLELVRGRVRASTRAGTGLSASNHARASNAACMHPNSIRSVAVVAGVVLPNDRGRLRQGDVPGLQGLLYPHARRAARGVLPALVLHVLPHGSPGRRRRPRPPPTVIADSVRGRRAPGGVVLETVLLPMRDVCAWGS
jgi:hypothetical protein